MTFPPVNRADVTPVITVSPWGGGLQYAFYFDFNIKWDYTQTDLSVDLIWKRCQDKVYVCVLEATADFALDFCFDVCVCACVCACLCMCMHVCVCVCVCVKQEEKESRRPARGATRGRRKRRGDAALLRYSETHTLTYSLMGSRWLWHLWLFPMMQRFRTEARRRRGVGPRIWSRREPSLPPVNSSKRWDNTC